MFLKHEVIEINTGCVIIFVNINLQVERYPERMVAGQHGAGGFGLRTRNHSGSDGSGRLLRRSRDT